MDLTKTESPAWRAIYAVAVVIVLAAFLYSVRAILNPFLLALVFLALASPFAGTRSHRLLMVTVAFLALFWLLATLGSLLAPFFLALALAYLLHPTARRLEARGLSRGLAIAVLSLPMIGLVLLLIFFGIPALAGQAAELVNGVPAALQSLILWLERMQAQVALRDWPLVDEEAVLERLRRINPDAVLGYLQARQAEIARSAWAAVTGAGRGLSVVLSILGYLFLTPILTFYLLRDWERLQSGVAELIPGVSRPQVVEFFREYDRLLSGYLRGTATQSAIAGVLTFVGLWVMGIPYAFLLGVMAGVFNIIPYLGLVLTLIPALVVALFTGDVLVSVGKVVLVFAVVQALDGAVVGPRIVGGSVGLNPVWVILALSIAGFFWGFLGLLLAVPLAVLLKLLLGLGLQGYRRSRIFAGEHA